MAFLFFLGFIIMAGVIYMAVSKKSTFKIRIAALGALALMIVSVVICLIVYFKGAPAPQQLVLPEMLGSELSAPVSNTSPVTMIMLSIFLLVLFAVIFFMAMREQRRAEGKEEKPGNDW